jgi:hypothetical protein
MRTIAGIVAFVAMMALPSGAFASTIINTGKLKTTDVKVVVKVVAVKNVSISSIDTMTFSTANTGDVISSKNIGGQTTTTGDATITTNVTNKNINTTTTTINGL